MSQLATDPWMFALIGTGALAVGGLVVAVLGRHGRGRVTGTWLANGGLTGILAATVGSALSPAPHDASGPAPDAEPTLATAVAPGDRAASAVVVAGTAVEDPNAAEGVEPPPEDIEPELQEIEDPSGEADPESAEDPVVIEVESEPAGSEENVEPPDEASTGVTPPGWPADPRARRAALSERVGEIRKSVANNEDCLEPERVAEAWTQLQAIPEGEIERRVAAAVKQLERCRDRIEFATGYRVRKARFHARESFAQTIEERLLERDIRSFSNALGSSNDHLRVGSTALTESLFDELVDGGLREEARKLGFSKITFATGKDTWVARIDEPVTDESVIEQELALQGLDQPFER